MTVCIQKHFFISCKENLSSIHFNFTILVINTQMHSISVDGQWVNFLF